MIRGYLLVSLLAVCGAAVEISVASEGGNATSNLQYGIMEEVRNNEQSTPQTQLETHLS